MKHSINRFVGCMVRATDGGVGTFQDFYFDDIAWMVRYMVVDTGGWLSIHKVLLPPTALGTPDWQARVFPVKLSKEQVEKSPSIDTDKPIDRQQEAELYRYYGWPVYWGANALASGRPVVPIGLPAAEGVEDAPWLETRIGNPNLRSTVEVTNYRIHATDGEIGQVEDFVVDDETWLIHFLVVNTRQWLPGRRVLVSPVGLTTSVGRNRKYS